MYIFWNLCGSNGVWVVQMNAIHKQCLSIECVLYVGGEYLFSTNKCYCESAIWMCHANVDSFKNEWFEYVLSYLSEWSEWVIELSLLATVLVECMAELAIHPEWLGMDGDSFPIENLFHGWQSCESMLHYKREGFCCRYCSSAVLAST